MSERRQAGAPNTRSSNWAQGPVPDCREFAGNENWFWLPVAGRRPQSRQLIPSPRWDRRRIVRRIPVCGGSDDAKLDDKIVDHLLDLFFGDCAGGQIALEINIKKG